MRPIWAVFKRFKAVLKGELGTIKKQSIKPEVRGEKQVKHQELFHLSIADQLNKLSINGETPFDLLELNQEITILLKNDPAAFLELFKTVKMNNRLYDYFEKHFALDQFVLALSNYSSVNIAEFQATLSFLIALTNQKGDRQTQLAMQRLSWSLFFSQLQAKYLNKTSASKLIQEFIKDLILKKGIKTGDIIAVIQSRKTLLSPLILKQLVKMNPIFAEFDFDDTQELEKESSDIQLKTANNEAVVLELNALLKTDAGVNLLGSLIIDNKIPNWFTIPDFNKVDALFDYIIQEFPQVLVNQIKLSNEFEQLTRALQRKLAWLLGLNS